MMDPASRKGEIDDGQKSVVQNWIRGPVEHLWEEKLTEQALPEIKEMVCPGDARGKLSGTRCSAQMKPPLKRVSFTSKKINRPSTAPLAPLRSSHRIGPVGTLGSVDHRRGENRWQPRIAGYERKVEKVRETKESKDKVSSTEDKEPVVVKNMRETKKKDKSSVARHVKLEPAVPYNSIVFQPNSRVRHNKTPVKLFKFEKIQKKQHVRLEMRMY